jgi:hypothetical protein
MNATNPSFFSRTAARILLGILAFFVLLVIGGYILVRSVLSPEKIRPLAEAKLSAALGEPVTLGDMGISLFPTPALRAGDIHIGAANTKAPSLSIASLRIIPSLASALHGQLVVDRVDLDGMDIAIRRDKQGNWELPYNPPKETGSAKPAAPSSSPGNTKPAAPSSGPNIAIRDIEITDGKFRLIDDAPPSGGPAREVAALQKIQGALAVDADGVSVDKLTAQFQKTELKGSASISAEKTVLDLASPSISSVDLPQIFAFLGAAPIDGLSVSGNCPFHLSMTMTQKGALSAKGEFDAAVLKLGTLEIKSLKTPVKVEHGTATLAPITFNAYSGSEKGSFALSIAHTPMGYSLATTLDGVDVNQALSANTSAKDVLLGTGHVQATVKGAGFDSNALKATLYGISEVAVKNGVVRNLPLLASINRALKITSGDSKDTKFDSLTGTFVIANGKAHTEDLLLKAGELSLIAKGDILFDLTLSFKGTAIFTGAKSAEFAHSVSELRGLVNDKGELAIPLTVSGPVSSPSVNVDLAALLSGAAKQQLKQTLGDKLKQLLGK